ncbi:LON peptidase substrate-binding domain-containing protein [Catalinimonas niigatensis]|uniref:LON peptidase substrate-binding domain-containing protein n=1 Tax=Catalinimonas niigatensis TaxID=1397264 RepID=UPI0026653166|nr:LON peptidase substrate-binding domain-containing protein [Catalinimonas niigatensis]WPP48609.1 LON peptidase substrate-binding domain-containing protein [Catalinimonas niigatensis]
MENYLPLFPLNLVAFPGEDVNLHIFEERYRQLSNESLEKNQPFGIPAYVDKKVEYGTEMYIKKVVKRYEDGRLDITTKAMRVFKVMSFINPVSGKLYAGGEVFYLDNIEDGDPAARAEMVSLVKELYNVMNVVKRVEVNADITTFEIGHKIGFSLDQEYLLLQIERERDRQLMIIEHLKKTIPLLREVERTKDIIRMNGHFKHFDPLDF